jgi:16S rRNA (uracil1498-N3)-methyltransferase
MKLHRFYVSDIELVADLVIDEKRYTHQWTKVLRFRVGREVALFNSAKIEYTYGITMIDKFGVRLKRLKKVESPTVKTELYLCFSLLKKDKTDWVLQKATELGASHFLPLMCDRTEKTGFDEERALKIVTEAAEQCGRADIPKIYEPTTPAKILGTLQDTSEIYIAEQGSPQLLKTNPQPHLPQAILIGPEGGWTDEEKQLFNDKHIKHLALSEFTLRAETAVITAAVLLNESSS